MAARNLVGNRRSALADRYLRGLEGIEIGGAAHNAFFLDTVNVDYSHTPPTAEAQLRHAGHVMRVDVLAQADSLPFADKSYDFVLASHVIEHIPSPLGALREWARVARRYLFVIIPARDNEYDRHRPVTPLAELIERDEQGFTSDQDRHWSVWTPEAFAEVVRHRGMEVVEIQEPDDKRRNGYAVVIGV